MRGRNFSLVDTITNWHSLSDAAAPIAQIARLMHAHGVQATFDCISRCNTPPAFGTG
jgi:hypothetical protein